MHYIYDTYDYMLLQTYVQCAFMSYTYMIYILFLIIKYLKRLSAFWKGLIIE